MWANVFRCFSLLVILLTSVACGPVGEYRQFKIDKRFSSSQKEDILKAANFWNEKYHQLTGDDRDVLTYAGRYSGPEFSEKSLIENEDVVFKADRDSTAWKRTAKDDELPYYTIGYTYDLNIAVIEFDNQFQSLMTHEFGHYIGVREHILEPGHLMSAKSLGNPWTTMDAELLCTLYDCN